MPELTNNTVHLNIGGTVFQTTKSTLTNFNGFFKNLEAEDTDENNAIFIDRSPKNFDLILNFMRDGDVDLPNSKKKVKQIWREAEYYLLDGLVKLCSEKLEKGNELQFIANNCQLLQIITDPKKPVLIFYCYVDDYGRIRYPSNFDTKSVMEQYGRQFDIYFKAFEKSPNNHKKDETMEWQYSLHYKTHTHYSQFQSYPPQLPHPQICSPQSYFLPNSSNHPQRYPVPCFNPPPINMIPPPQMNPYQNSFNAAQRLKRQYEERFKEGLENIIKNFLAKIE